MCYQPSYQPCYQTHAIIDYGLDGPRSAAAVASGKSRLQGLTLALPGQPAVHHTADFATHLAAIGDRPRIYYDAPLAFAVELKYGLPSIPSYDDVRAMLALLQQDRSPALRQAEALRDRDGKFSDSADASLARVREMQQLLPQLVQRIEVEGLAGVYREIELPIAIPTSCMTSVGLPFNRRMLVNLRNQYASKAEWARRKIRELAGDRFNPDDSAAVARILDESGLPVTETTNKGNRSTSRKALAELEKLNPVVPPLMDYRDAKPVFDIVTKILDALGPDNLVHANLDPLGTETGRFSCSDPPLQALDVRVRSAVEARPGCVLMEADYSQMELRVLAHFSQDERLLDAFRRGEDLHRRTASLVLGVPEDAITEQQRDQGKTINFGIVYGQTAHGLSKELGITNKEAEAHLSAYAEAYPGVAAWIAAVQERAAACGEVRTLYGRRRLLPNIFSANPADAAEARRQAVNTMVQGTAADILKLAILRLDGVLPVEVKLLLPVHDSMLLEVPEGLVDATRSATIEAMKMPPHRFGVPLKVEVSTGKTWAECKKA